MQWGAVYPGSSDTNLLPCPGFNVSIQPEGSEIVRVKALIEVHVVTYSYDPAPRPLDVNWWEYTYPAVGIFWDDTGLTQGEIPDPLVGGSSAGFLINETLSGEVEWKGLDTNGNNMLTYHYVSRSGSLVSKSRRRPTTASNVPQLWVTWNFFDPTDLINRTTSFPQAYDLYVKWAVRSWWIAAKY